MKIKLTIFSVFLLIFLIIIPDIQVQATEIRQASMRSPVVLLSLNLVLIIVFLIVLYLYLKAKSKLKASQKKNAKLLEIQPLNDRNTELSLIIRRLSHDLREFLVNVEELAHISLLESEDSPINEYLHMQVEVLSKMKLLLFRVMEIERIREHSPTLSSINLAKYFKNIIRSMRRIDGGREIDILVDISDNFVIQSDSDMLEIAFDNLIRNTIEHNYPPDKPLRMNIVGREFQKSIQISIADNGRGIPKELRDKVFGLFISNLNKRLGFGLGLYKTKLALEKVNGKIQLLPSEHGETIFHISLPKNSL